MPDEARRLSTCADCNMTNRATLDLASDWIGSRSCQRMRRVGGG